MYSIQEYDDRIKQVKYEARNMALVTIVLCCIAIWLVHTIYSRQEHFEIHLKKNTERRDFLLQFQVNCTLGRNGIMLPDGDVIACSEVHEWERKDIIRASENSSKYSGPGDWFFLGLMLCLMFFLPVIHVFVFREEWHDLNLKRNDLLNHSRR